MPLPASSAAYWLGLPARWAYQAAHNGHGILRVLDITILRPMTAGLVAPDHPWVTGINPATGRTIWADNVIYRSPRTRPGLPGDDRVLDATGRFLAARVARSAATPEIPVGPRRRMPHGINYIHGACHYNSGLVLFDDLADGFRHVTSPAFRAEVKRFVKRERREVLFLFRDRDYSLREFAYFGCCLRTLFPWFCNVNGPKARVLWGNAAPFPAANLITGAWVRDVLALRRPGGADEVVRPSIAPREYFTAVAYPDGRSEATWPEKLLAWGTHLRVRLRGARGGMFFVDRRLVFADRLAHRRGRGRPDDPVGRL